MIRPFKRPGLTIVIIGVIAVMLVMGYAKFRRSGAATPATSERGDQSPYVAIASGRVDISGGIIAVAARRAGTIRAVYVQEGDRVRAGQILAQQDDTDAKLAEGRARAQVSEANARLTALQVALSTARREFARIEPLFKRGYVSTQRLDAASDQIRSAEANLNAQKAERVAAQSELRQAEYDRELTTIRAPVNGLIVRRYANPGVGASTLNVSNMFDIQPDADLIVRAEVDETTLPLVTVGQLVDVSTEAGGLTVPGRVLRRGAMFGSKTLQDEQTDRTDERVVTVIVGIGRAPLLVGQRVIVRFLKPCSARAVAAPGHQALATGSSSGDGRCR